MGTSTGARGRLTLLLPVLLVAGCSTGDPGPLGDGREGGVVQLCTPAVAGKPVVLALDVLRNTGDGAAVLDEVRLVDAQDLLLRDAQVLPLVGGTTLEPVWPPRSPAWERRRAVAGTALAPGSDPLNLVLVLELTAAEGSAADVEVAYRSGGRAHVHRVGTAARWTTASTGC